MAPRRRGRSGCVRALSDTCGSHTVRDRVRPRERTRRGSVHARAAVFRRRDDSRDRSAGDEGTPEGAAYGEGTPSGAPDVTGVRLAGAGLLRFPLDRAADLPSRLAGAAPEVTANLVHLALRAHALVARRASDDLLAHALDLLTGTLDFLLSRLSADCAHDGSPRPTCASRPVPLRATALQLQ